MKNLQIETDLNYAYEMYRWDYEDSFITIQSESRYKNTVLLYTDCGNLSEDFSLSVNYEKIISRGYNHGDYAEILINTKEFKEVFGAEFISSSEKQNIDNLLWGYPIMGEIAISFDYEYSMINEELGQTFLMPIHYKKVFGYDEICNSKYKLEINTDLVIDLLKRDLKANLDFSALIKMLENLDYNDIKNNSCNRA